VNDWKTMSRFLSDMAHKFGVGLSTPDCQNGFGLVGGKAFVEEPGLECKFTMLTPKRIRRWLWEARYNPVWKEPGVLVYVEREDPTGWVGRVGRVGDPAHEQAIVFTETA
jgi:hypothetical protein